MRKLDAFLLISEMGEQEVKKKVSEAKQSEKI